MQKSLHILYNHRTRARDGQSVHIDDLIEAFRAEGHTVKIVAPARTDAMSHGIERDIFPKTIYELMEFCFSIIEFFQIFVAVRRKKPDFIYQRANLHMLGAVWVAKLLGIRLFIEVNAPLARERRNSPGLAWPKLARLSEHHLWRHASMVLPVTEVLAQEVAAAGVPRNRIAVVANGVNPDRFRPNDREHVRAAAGLKGRLILGFVGYVREWHGLEHVIELLATDARLGNGHLVIVGDGPARPALTTKAHRLGVADRVFFTGVITRDDVAKVATSFDIALQPDVTPYASPLKLFEYMAMGHAIVAPDLPNIREVLSHDEDAILFAPGDAKAFSEAVARLAQNADLRRRLGLQAMRNIAVNDRTWRANARRIAAMASEQAQGRTVKKTMIHRTKTETA